MKPLYQQAARPVTGEQRVNEAITQVRLKGSTEGRQANKLYLVEGPRGMNGALTYSGVFYWKKTWSTEFHSVTSQQRVPYNLQNSCRTDGALRDVVDRVDDTGRNAALRPIRIFFCRQLWVIEMGDACIATVRQVKRHGLQRSNSSYSAASPALGRRSPSAALSLRVESERRALPLLTMDRGNHFLAITSASINAAGIPAHAKLRCFSTDVQEPSPLDNQHQSFPDVRKDSVSTKESETQNARDDDRRWRAVKKKLGQIASNARRHAMGLQGIRHSLGVDFGDSKTGIAISLEGYAPRPLTVLHLKGDKLLEALMKIGCAERADEFIVGLPKSSDGRENSQSNKARSFAGRLATQAAQRGWRVYLEDEYGSSLDGLGYMLDIGMKKRSRKEMLDAYAAMVLLRTYFDSEGALAKLVVPKGLPCQESLCRGDSLTTDDGPIDYE